MKNSPKVVSKINFDLAINNNDNHYNSLNKDYVQDRKLDALRMNKYFSDKAKEPKRMLDYFSNNYKSIDNKINLVKEDGTKATLKEMEERSKNIAKYIDNSNIWKGFISFKTDYLIENISLSDLESKFALEIMPKFFKKVGFVDSKKMNYQFSIHTDKEHHYHIHFSFCEKEPNYKNRDGKLIYRRQGLIKQEYQDFLKREIILEIERNRFKPILKELNESIEEFKKYFSPNTKEFVLKDIKDIELEYKIYNLGILLNEYKPNSKKIKYGSIKNNELGKKIKELTSNIKKEIMLEFKSINISKEKINQDFAKLNTFYITLNKDNNISRNIKNNELINVKKKYIESYVVNSIINHALTKARSTSKITIDDYIKLIAKKNYVTSNKKEVKKIILRNYFNSPNNKYKQRQEIIDAVKNISNELEEASNEFHKLFVYDYRQNNLY